MGGALGRTPGSQVSLLPSLVKQEGLRFLEQELANITIPDLVGREGSFHYNISE